MLCLRKISVAKTSMDKKGYQDFPSKNFLSYSADFFHRGNLLCCVSQKFQ